ncbi:MAG TPA: hypothetical protein VM537_13030 [Anaerolineae bacterium]|nr:hypothetical protein [Anaerolineae bacterium]
MIRDNWKRILLRFLVELTLYGLLLLAYFLLVLRYLGNPLSRMSQDNLWLYAVLGLGLMIAQAVLLDVITSFLVQQLGLERLK